jgi:hypothetical protein
MAAMLLCCSIHAGGVAGTRPAQHSPAHVAPGLAQWLPEESWPGKAQHDPRLDRTVRFWGAGIPLKDVFASVEEQTGVEIGFWPPGDDNERICVNLYLDPDRPPTLRELMAQLSWVVDCGFACSDGAETKTYALLSTSIGAGALLERLKALRDALELPVDELIGRYRGVDDLLLLAALDPARRAVAQFLLTLSDDDLAELAHGKGMYQIEREWRHFSAEQRAFLREAMRACPDRRRDWERFEQHVESVLIQLSCCGGAQVDVLVGDPAEPTRAHGSGLPFLQLAVNPRQEDSLERELRSQFELRKLLGEEASQEEQNKVLEPFSALGHLHRQRRERRERMLARRSPLSHESESLLSSLSVSLDTGRPYALWQIQELVAALSGLHVVSDCFWQPERSLKPMLSLLHREPAQDLDALTVLRTACLPSALQHDGPHLEDLSDGGVSWELADAGSFLRFRDSHRDVCREMLLPEDATDLLDGWVDAHIPPEQGENGDVRPAAVQLDLRAYGRIFTRLSPAQRRWGWYLIYGPPTERGNSYRHAFRESLRKHTLQDHPFVLFAHLDDRQWEQLQTEGLTWGVDVVVYPGPDDRDPRWGDWPAYEEGDVLRLRDSEPIPEHWFAVPKSPASWRVFYGQHEGGERREVTWGEFIPARLVVTPKDTTRLIETEADSRRLPAEAPR